MALPIQEQLKALLQNTVKKPQLIFEIDGLPLFSSTPPQKYAKYGDDIFYGDIGLVYGGLIDDNTALPYIDLSKSTNQITQQMLVDKGGFSSVTSFDVSLIDKDQVITQLITPNNVIEDILSRKARIYLSVEGAGHPKDSILFFTGIVAGVSAGAGYVNINVASPEKLKNLEIFTKVSTELTANINSSATTINVVSTSDFSLPADSGTLRTYLIIGDEYIEYTGSTSTSFTGCVRGQFGSIAVSHNINDNAESAYRLIGNLRDLSLKLMLSGLNTPYLLNEPVLSFNTYGPYSINNAIFVTKYNFDQYYGAVAGDIITISGASHAANNITTTINSIFTNDLGSYIILNSNLTTEGSGAIFSITSKYAVLPKFCGLEMTPDQVDVVQFEKIFTQFSANFFPYDFFIKDQVNGNDFINTQILYPSGCYALPRKAKTSVGMTIPPLAQSETRLLNESNTISAAQMKIVRNISNNFYNAIVIKYDQDQVDDKFKRGKITQSSNSTNRIKVANKPLTIEAQGVRTETGFADKFDIVARRFLDRYQYAAESLNIQIDYGTGFGIEIGDTVIVQGLQLSDTKDLNASREFRPRLFEVQNKVLNLKGAPIQLSLVDSAYSLNRRYGIVSVSSKIDSGSTTTNLKLKKSFGTTLGFSSETYKWKNYIGEQVRVTSKDYTYDHVSTFIAIDPANEDGMILDPALPTAPLADYLVNIIQYPTSTDSSLSAIYKTVFVYFDKQLSVLTGISQTQFTVSSSLLSKIKVSDIVLIHNKSFSNESVERTVADITGTTITVDSALGYIPATGDKIELLGFDDSGKPYGLL